MTRPRPDLQIAPRLPRRGGRLGRFVARRVYGLLGWRFDGELPNLSKAVIIVAHHTSNWDFVVGAVAMLALGVRVSWLGKHTVFRWPLGPLMRWLGGIPVRRTIRAGVVEQTADAFHRSEGLLIALSPEGTRRAVPRWKTGFYHIARSAGVPVVPVALDWGRRAIAFGPPLEPSGDLDADLAALEAFFVGAEPKRPEGLSRVRGMQSEG